MLPRQVPAASPPSRHLAALGAFLLLAVAWTWPLATRLASHLPHDAGDPLLNTCILWWNAQAVPFTARWWSPPFFYPLPDALALSEHLLGIALVTAPLQFAGAGPIAAYNVAFALSFALSGFFAYLLVHRLTGSTLAGLLGGIAFGFSPYRAGQLSHLQVLTSQWMPLMLLAMHAYVKDARRRWLVLFGAAWTVQALSNGYYLLFLPTLIVPWLAWFVDWRNGRTRGLMIAAAWAGSSLLLLPALAKYAAVLGRLGLSRDAGDVLQFSARAQSFLHAAPLTFWPASVAANSELYLFPGAVTVTLTVIALAAAVRRRGPGNRAALFFYAAAALVMAALALGPAPPGSGIGAAFHPYSLLMPLPGYSGLRVPARFGTLVVLSLAIAGGLALAQVLPRRRIARAACGALVLALAAAEGWPRAMPLASPPALVDLASAPPGAVVELPLDEPLAATAAMYRGTQHGRPLVTGYSGYVPPHYFILSHGLRRRDPSGLLELARGRRLLLVVNEEFDRNGDMLRLVGSVPGAAAAGRSSVGPLFVLPAQPRARTAPLGSPVAIAMRRELPREHAVLDLGTLRSVRTVAFSVGARYLDLGGRFAVEASEDGESWQTAWEDWTAGPAIAGALRDPRAVPIEITLPDIRARYLRLHPAPRWLLDTVRIYQP